MTGQRDKKKWEMRYLCFDCDHFKTIERADNSASKVGLCWHLDKVVQSASVCREYQRDGVTPKECLEDQ